ncbi:TspO/MBR family protein [Afipia sp. DC4300-2b1]|uniref:TspO/MBR family protein n=1 Tax=Afipia sp. DC4300-2b1 TaxID=2804672 RepID=UPI003CF3A140
MSAGRALWKPILIAACVAIFIGVLGGTLTDTGPWYQNLRKPSWQPPDWLFGPAWTLIFALATASAVYAWRSASDKAQREWVIGLFALNGFLNVLWSTLFFALRRPDWALIEVVFLLISILMLIVSFWRRSLSASLYLLPYLVWVAFAAVLNLEVVRLNGPF